MFRTAALQVALIALDDEVEVSLFPVGKRHEDEASTRRVEHMRQLTLLRGRNSDWTRGSEHRQYAQHAKKGAVINFAGKLAS
jgi:hypothetical protein